MTTRLVPHPALPPLTPLRVLASASPLASGRLSFEFKADGDLGAIKIPAPAAPARKDGLWRTTCFEGFLHGPSGAYLEFNFAPSSEWAAYSFSAYREGMTPADAIAAPAIDVHRTAQSLALIAIIDIPPRLFSFAEPFRLGLSAVIEELTGSKSYWARAHLRASPDFHDSAAYALCEGLPRQ